MRIPLARPDITEREKQAVAAVMESEQLSIGPQVNGFERAIADYIGTRYAIAVNSGTSGLHLALTALGVGHGDEVITTPFSFIASANAALYERAEPVFADIDERTLCIDPESLQSRITRRTKCILPVDVFGQPAALDEIRSIADDAGIPVLEDACEALGSEYRGVKAGTPIYAQAAVFAFYPNKQITTGEGGMIVTDDDRLAMLCRSMRNQGRGEAGLWLHHERLGYNYRLDELSSALGLAQMARLDEMLTKRDLVARRYSLLLSGVDGITTPYVAAATTRMSWFVYVIRFDPSIDRDSVMLWLHQQGIGCRPYFTPIHLQPFFRRQFGFKEGDFPITERVAQSTLAIPFYNQMTDEEASHVVAALKEAVHLFRRE